MGYEIVLLDLPPHERSTVCGTFEYICQDIEYVETEFTASAAYAPYSWPLASRHDKWPRTGRRGDLVFANYCKALTTAVTDRTM